MRNNVWSMRLFILMTVKFAKNMIAHARKKSILMSLTVPLPWWATRLLLNSSILLVCCFTTRNRGGLEAPKKHSTILGARNWEIWLRDSTLNMEQLGIHRWSFRINGWSICRILLDLLIGIICWNSIMLSLWSWGRRKLKIFSMFLQVWINFKLSKSL